MRLRVRSHSPKSKKKAHKSPEIREVQSEIAGYESDVALSQAVG